jgi:hypothetical protein
MCCAPALHLTMHFVLGLLCLGVGVAIEPQRVALATADHRQFVLTLVRHNRELYARTHDYSYYARKLPAVAEVGQGKTGHQVAKVQMMSELLGGSPRNAPINTSTQYDWAIWLDSDVWIVAHDRSLEAFVAQATRDALGQAVNFILPRDHAESLTFSTFAMAIRSTPETIAVVDTWLKLGVGCWGEQAHMWEALLRHSGVNMTAYTACSNGRPVKTFGKACYCFVRSFTQVIVDSGTKCAASAVYWPPMRAWFSPQVVDDHGLVYQCAWRLATEIPEKLNFSATDKYGAFGIHIDPGKRQKLYREITGANPGTDVPALVTASRRTIHTAKLC